MCQGTSLFEFNSNGYIFKVETCSLHINQTNIIFNKILQTQLLGPQMKDHKDINLSQ
jgi:hypothetical protein